MNSPPESVEGGARGDFRAAGESGLSAGESAGRSTAGPGTRVLRGVVQVLAVFVSSLLNLAVTKPISLFVWWLHARANHTTFHGRAELARRVKRARRAGNPVLFASNHLSMFDDPVIPMALFGTGPRAAAEFSCLAALLALWWATPPVVLPTPAFAVCVIAYSAGIALWGARKTWWSIGDLVNFGGASALRGKLEFGRERPLSLAMRALLALADPIISSFMRSAAVKTLLVDRRPCEEGRQSRARALESGIELAARGEQIWVFFEGGRSRDPDGIRPARGGIGQLVKVLRARGIRPMVIAIHHRGLEHVIPLSSRHWITSGHRIDIRWSECDLEGHGTRDITARDSRKIAGDIRAAVVRLQSAWRSEHQSGA